MVTSAVRSCYQATASEDVTVDKSTAYTVRRLGDIPATGEHKLKSRAGKIERSELILMRV
jgi:hypothetical protein